MKKIVLLALSLLVFFPLFSQENTTYKKGVLTLPNGVVYKDGDTVMLGVGSGPRMEYRYVRSPKSLVKSEKTIATPDNAFKRYTMFYAQAEKNDDNSKKWIIGIGTKDAIMFRCDIIKALETGEIYKIGYNKSIVEERTKLYQKWEQKLRDNQPVDDLSVNNAAPVVSKTTGIDTSNDITTPEEADKLTFVKISAKLDAAVTDGIITGRQSEQLKQSFDPNQLVWIVEAVNHDYITHDQGELLKTMEHPQKTRIIDWLDMAVKAGIITPQQSAQMKQAGKKYISDVLNNSVSRKIITQTQGNQLKERIFQ